MMNDEERRDKVAALFAWPLAEEFDAMDPLDRPFWQAQMVVRQRYAELHDPGCAKEMIRRQQMNTGVALVSPECDCWLSRCVLVDCDGTGAETGPRRKQRYAFRQEEGAWYDAPSIAVTQNCPRCNQFVQICTKGHCMYCGTKVSS